MSEPIAEIPCKQCGKLFVPKNKYNTFHTERCRWDHRNQRSKEESVRRTETGFAWDPIRPAAKITVKVPKKRDLSGFRVSLGWKTAAIIPDTQFGHRRFLDTGDLDPFHDPRAIDIIEQVIEAERPDVTVLLGDVVDLPTYGRFRQEPEFIGGVQPGIDRASVHIETVSELSNETHILKGNHDIRIENYSMDNALASAGLRRARRRPDEFPVLTMEFLLGTSEMKNVTWHGGYPAGAYYINDNLATIHGRITGKNLAEKVINTERKCVIFGHVHSYVDGISTFNDRDRPIFVRAHSPGCACRIDGAVPSTRSGRDPFGRPARSWEDWQQGMSIVRYLEGDGRFTIEHIPIFEGWSMHRGAEFTSDKAVNDPELELIPVSGRVF